MAVPNGVGLVINRSLSISAVAFGKRNFRKFLVYGKRGTRQFKEEMQKNPDPELEKLFGKLR